MMNVLCVCTGNTCRSPMLAALLRAALRRQVVAATVESAGTAAGQGEPASAGALAAMARRGLDLSAHRSRALVGLDLGGIDHVCTVSSRHAAFVRSLGVPPGRISVVAADRGGVPDPWGGDEEAYEEAARTLEAEAERLARSLSAQTE